MDTGDYQCNVTVLENSGQPLILPSSSTATTSLNISGIILLSPGLLCKLYACLILFPSSVVCNSENTITEQFGSYSWPATPVGDTVTLPCVFRPDYNASRSCTQGGSWVAVDITKCRISEYTSYFRMKYCNLSLHCRAVDSRVKNFTLYMRFSSFLSVILAGQNIQGALRNIENVVCIV